MCPLTLGPGFFSGTSNLSSPEADAVDVPPISTEPVGEVLCRQFPDTQSPQLSLLSCSLRFCLRVLSGETSVLLHPAHLKWEGEVL